MTSEFLRFGVGQASLAEDRISKLCLLLPLSFRSGIKCCGKS